MRSTRFPFLPASLLTALLATAPAVQAADPCLPGAYTGYTATGPKGALEMDMAWHRRVRGVATPGGCLRYVLRAAPRAGTFDSIEPVPLGAYVKGFVATAGGQRRLFDPQGRALLEQPFDGDVQVVLDEGHALTLRVRHQRTATYLRAQQSRIVARAPRWYAYPGASAGAAPGAPTSASPAIDTGTPGHALREAQGLIAVAAPAEGGGQGKSADAESLLDLRTLRELLPTRYARVGLLADGAAPGRPWLLFGHHGPAGGGALDFFLPDGRPAGLPAAHALQAHRQGEAIEHLTLHDQDAQVCHYIGRALKPLLPVAVPAPDLARCPALREGETLRFTDTTGHVQRLRYSAQDGAQPLGAPLPGTLVAAHADRFMLRLPPPAASAASAASATSSAAASTPPAAAPRFMAYTDAGQPLPDASGFDQFENLGCGVWRVQRGGTWYELGPQGQLSTPLGTPSGC